MCPRQSWSVGAQGENVQFQTQLIIIVNANMKPQISLSEAWSKGIRIHNAWAIMWAI